MNPLRRLWNRRPWRPKGEPSVWAQLIDRKYQTLPDKLEWKEITLEQLTTTRVISDTTRLGVDQFITARTVNSEFTMAELTKLAERKLGGGSGSSGTDTRPK